MADSADPLNAVRSERAGEPTVIADPGLRFGPFVALMASLMAINALGIDSMLAALPAIGHALHVPTDNERQFIVSTYVLGFGIAQLAWGPLADRFGRRPTLLAGLLSFMVLSLVAGLANTFPLMLVARVFQGIAAASSRILAMSIIRDCYSGRTMARVASLSVMVFLAVPVIAPTLGQLILLVTGDWRAIFHFLALFSAVLAVASWIWLRETLHPQYRRSLAPRAIAQTMLRACRDRMLIGYAVAQGLVFGGLLGFVNSVQQIFTDIFGLPRLFTLAFALAAGGMIAAAFLNARIVERLGTRRVSHSAVLGYTGIGLVHTLVALAGYDRIEVFIPVMVVQMFFFGFCGPNFGAMGLEKVGDIAGTASSVQGFILSVVAVAVGLVVSQSYNGSTLPLSLGFLVLGAGSLLVVLATERGRLFVPHTPDPAGA